MSEPIRPDTEDRYVSHNSPPLKASQKSNKPILSKTKWIILVLALCVIVGVIVSALLKSESTESHLGNTSNTTTSSSLNEKVEYKALTPPEMSTIATETSHIQQKEQERIEISGEVIDALANKINDLDDTESPAILFKGVNDSTDPLVEELPLEKNLNNNHYTIQINSSSSFESILAFVKQHKLSNYQIYETYRESNPWFVLIKGNYATIEDAKQAILLLPLELQQSQPWIKSGEQVNKELSSK